MTDNQITVENKKTRKKVLTPAKEEYDFDIQIKEPTAFFHIVNKNGGRVPQKLSGLYTTRDFAETDIKSYMTKQRKGA